MCATNPLFYFWNFDFYLCETRKCSNTWTRIKSMSEWSQAMSYFNLTNDFWLNKSCFPLCYNLIKHKIKANWRKAILNLSWLRILVIFQQKQHFTINASMMYFFIICTLFLGSNAIEITTKQGTVRGFEQLSRNGTKFHTFLAIPYAKPPVGRLRFEVSE